MMIYNISVNGKEYEVEVREKKAIPSDATKPLSVPETSISKSEPKPVVKEAVSQSKTPPLANEAKGIKVQAPMPGKIMAVYVKKGETVALNQALCVLEAMKMENDISSPKAGIIEEVYIRDSDQVETGDLLFTIVE